MEWQIEMKSSLRNCELHVSYFGELIFENFVACIFSVKIKGKQLTVAFVVFGKAEDLKPHNYRKLVPIRH